MRWYHRRNSLAAGLRISMFFSPLVTSSASNFNGRYRVIMLPFPPHFPGVSPYQEHRPGSRPIDYASKPVPPNFLLVEPSACWNASKIIPLLRSRGFQYPCRRPRTRPLRAVAPSTFHCAGRSSASCTTMRTSIFPSRSVNQRHWTAGCAGSVPKPLFIGLQRRRELFFITLYIEFDVLAPRHFGEQLFKAVGRDRIYRHLIDLDLDFSCLLFRQIEYFINKRQQVGTGVVNIGGELDISLGDNVLFLFSVNSCESIKYCWRKIRATYWPELRICIYCRLQFTGFVFDVYFGQLQFFFFCSSSRLVFSSSSHWFAAVLLLGLQLGLNVSSILGFCHSIALGWSCSVLCWLQLFRLPLFLPIFVMPRPVTEFMAMPMLSETVCNNCRSRSV